MNHGRLLARWSGEPKVKAESVDLRNRAVAGWVPRPTAEILGRFVNKPPMRGTGWARG